MLTFQQKARIQSFWNKGLVESSFQMFFFYKPSWHYDRKCKSLKCIRFPTNCCKSCDRAMFCQLQKLFDCGFVTTNCVNKWQFTTPLRTGLSHLPYVRACFPQVCSITNSAALWGRPHYNKVKRTTNFRFRLHQVNMRNVGAVCNHYCCLNENIQQTGASNNACLLLQHMMINFFR